MGYVTKNFRLIFDQFSCSLLRFLVSRSQSLALALSATDCTSLFSSIGYDDLLFLDFEDVSNTDFATGPFL